MNPADIRARIYQLADHDDAKTRIIMGDDPRLPEMPDAPILADFFRLRFSDDTQHLLQSARLAAQSGQNEKVIMACLLHDIAVCGFIQGDHGYWGEMMILPYVDEEIAWAVRTHQALRFYADESVGYTYPDVYKEWFGDDYQPDAYIEHEYQQARKHKWYMTSRLVTLNDHYSFDKRMSSSNWMNSPTSSVGISGNPRKVWDLTTVTARICGAPSFVPTNFFDLSDAAFRAIATHELQ
jgi:hypothetical protein